MVTTVSSRELNQDIGRAKRAALSGPVFITDRGKPAHVLLSVSEYQRLVGRSGSLADALSMLGLSDIELDTEKAAIVSRSAELD